MAPHGIAVLSLIGIVQIVIGQQPLFGWQGNQNPVAPLRGLDVPPFQRLGFGRDSFFGDRNGFGNQEEITVYTCIGRNTNGDELRVTFSDGARQNRWGGGWFDRQRVQMEARVSVSGQSQTRGQFQLIATEYGRVEDGCVSQALGNIIDNAQNVWFARRRPNSEIGILGEPFTLAPNQGHTSTTNIEGFANAAALNGHGLALCATRGLSAGSCISIIPLCCKIGRDAKRATELIQPNPGFGGGLNGNNLFASSAAMPGAMPGSMQGPMPGSMQGAMPGAMPGSTGTGGLPGTTGTAGAAAPQFQALFGGA
ncbi:uncharacterized protein [Haliotis cracherodii]|uniref:uncharacterized protein n=1 Tax=Haliotis cracherodii TaxID=6455 RepID=UPI0039EC192F